MRSIMTLATMAATAPFAQAAVTTTDFPENDAGFLFLTDNGQLEQAVAEGRIGNGATNGTWEMAIWDIGGSGSVQAQEQLAPASGVSVPFRITWDGVSTLTYDVDGTQISWNNVAGPFTDIFIRTRSVDGSSMLLDNLKIDGTDLDITSLLSMDNEVDYLRIRDMGMDFGAFALTGDHTFSWTGNRPNNSALAYQFKFTNVIPGAPSLAALALAAPVLRRRR